MAVEVTPSRFVLGHYDYLAHQPYEAPSDRQSLPGLNPFAAFALQRSQALFPQPARYVANQHIRSQAQLNTAAKEWKANHLSGAVVFRGQGENPGFGVGRLLQVTGVDGQQPPQRHDYGTYRLTSVGHTVREDLYQNTFSALPHLAEMPMPNPQVQAPLGTPELAEVIDGTDPQHLGRIRVRFHWNVAQPQEAESGWLRVTTPYSGDGKGHLFTPEVGSQVLVNYEQHLAEFPVVVGNLFHPDNKQGAKYTTEANHLKGLQTAGGNKLVLSDKPGAQTILLSNSHNKSTAIQVSFQGDGSVHIQSNGPVTVNGNTITLDAGEQGEIKMHAKTITMQAEEEVSVRSKNIALRAKQNITVEATDTAELKGKKATLTGSENAGLLSPQTVDVGTGTTVNISAATVNQS